MHTEIEKKKGREKEKQEAERKERTSALPVQFLNVGGLDVGSPLAVPTSGVIFNYTFTAKGSGGIPLQRAVPRLFAHLHFDKAKFTALQASFRNTSCAM